MKQLLYYLLLGTRGGETRIRLLSFLIKTPSNAHKIAQSLHLDYKTVRHHLEVLEKNRLIFAIEKKSYGSVYFVTPEFELMREEFDSIAQKANIE